MTRLQILTAGFLLATVPAGQPAEAATTTGVVAVSAIALNVCLLTPGILNFGNYVGEEVDANAPLTVTCTVGTTYNLGLNPGSAPGATVTTRQMRFLTNTLSYSLFRDEPRTANWGDTIGTDTVAGTGTGLPQVVTVYGRIAGEQYVAPGTYTDAVTVTLTY